MNYTTYNIDDHVIKKDVFTKTSNILTDFKFYQRCQECDTLCFFPKTKSAQKTLCPLCNTKICNGQEGLSFTQLGVITTILFLLMPFAWSQPLFQLYFFGFSINLSLSHGIEQVIYHNNLFIALIVLFFIIVIPIMTIFITIYLWLGNILHINLRPALLLLSSLKEWITLDLFFFSIVIVTVSILKYIWLSPKIGLLLFNILMIVNVLIIRHLNIEKLWRHFYPQPVVKYLNNKYLQVCFRCYFTGYPDRYGRCPRCYACLNTHFNYNLQRCWATTVTAIILLLSTNYFPISIISIYGLQKINIFFSGIILIFDYNTIFAGVILIFSTFIPFAKIILLITLLFSIYYQSKKWIQTRIRLLRFLKLINRWSILNLFIISIVIIFINCNNQILTISIGHAGLCFSSSIVCTMLAIQWLDSRFLWKIHESNNVKYTY